VRAVTTRVSTHAAAHVAALSATRTGIRRSTLRTWYLSDIQNAPPFYLSLSVKVMPHHAAEYGELGAVARQSLRVPAQRSSQLRTNDCGRPRVGREGMKCDVGIAGGTGAKGSVCISARRAFMLSAISALMSRRVGWTRARRSQ
jgi:hypothetical protein